MATGHLVPDGNHPLGGHVDNDFLQDTTAQFITTFHAVEFAVTFVDGIFQSRLVLLVGLIYFSDLPTAAHAARDGLDREAGGSFCNILGVLFVTNQRVVVVVC